MGKKYLNPLDLTTDDLIMIANAYIKWLNSAIKEMKDFTILELEKEK